MNPIDAAKAQQVAAYQLRSYRRISTPAYGGDDQDERRELVESVTVSYDAKQIQLNLSSLRAGFVYEINVGEIGIEGEELFPNQAHYTMRSIPK